MAKKSEKKSRCASAKASTPSKECAAQKAVKKETKTVKAAKAQTKKASPKKVKHLVRGKVVKADLKGKKKHEIKKTGEVIRFDQRKHPEKTGAHHVHIHGKEVDDGLQLVTPAAQPSIISSLRSRDSIAPGSEFSFARAQDFVSIE
jgi:hypothetical protein